MRSALGQFHQIDPAWILPGNGAAELLTWACRELAALDGVYLLTPAFSDYLRALQAFGAKVLALPLPLERLGEANTPLSVLSGLPQRSTDLLRSRGLLLNNPHNPTGLLLGREGLLPLLQRFSLVVIDEAFMDFLPEAEQQSLLDQVQNWPNLVIVRSLTKFYSLPGLRLGYAISNPERLQRWQQWRDPWPVNSLAAAAAVAIVQDHTFQRQTWDWLATARPQLFQGLAQLPGCYPLPGAANFLLVRSETSVPTLQMALLQQQILIRDCLSFAELGDRYFRVAVRLAPENQRLLAGLRHVLGGQEDLRYE